MKILFLPQPCTGSAHSKSPVLRKHLEHAGSFALHSAVDSNITKLIGQNILTPSHVYAAAQAR